MPAVVVVPAMVWVTLLLVAGGLVRARDVQQRVVALDLLAVVAVALLALLSCFWDVGYYLDAAVALSLLSFVATVAAARYLASGGPFGRSACTASCGCHTYSQLHAQGLATGPGVIAVPGLLGGHGERGDHHLRRARDRLRRTDIAGVRARHRAGRTSSRQHRRVREERCA